MAQNKRKRIYIMSGVPGVGKTSFILHHISEFGGITRVVSRDAIRFNLLDEEDKYFSKEKEVWKKFIEEIIESLDDPVIDNIIIDATHLNEKSRNKLFNAIGKHHLTDIEVNNITLVASLEFVLENNRKREGLAYVPETAIRNMYNNFKIPEYTEGFHKILIVNAEKESDLF